tara:strand:+ start:33551 stop:34156 length:606 start_codon:yes stop_codon:yes gene_type:complete
MIGIINYGLGNISAFKYAFDKLNCKTKIINTKSDLNSCTHIILPGVGSFDYAIKLINKSGLVEKLYENVMIHKKPLLTVCVGMQMLFERSDEGKSQGLGWIKGKVKKFDLDLNLDLPHMGWNTITLRSLKDEFCKNLNQREFYFLHSFHCVPDDKEIIISTAFYGEDFCSSIKKENIIGCQFHPEKSHDAGLEIFSEFIKI